MNFKVFLPTLTSDLNDSSVANRKAVQQVHHDDHDQKDEDQEEHVPDWRVEGQVCKLQFAHEHCKGLDDAQAQKVEKAVLVVLGLVTVAFVQEDVEAEGEGKNKQGVPKIEMGVGFNIRIRIYSNTVYSDNLVIRSLNNICIRIFFITNTRIISRYMRVICLKY